MCVSYLFLHSRKGSPSAISQLITSYCCISMQLTETSFVMREVRLTLSLVLRVKTKMTDKTDRGVGAFRALGRETLFPI